MFETDSNRYKAHLYAMYHNLRLLPDGRYRKSAAVVGEVMAKYHPHGDSSIYEALVRMAQPFSLRHPLVDGQGNFGSLDGDNAAAMRYTSANFARWRSDAQQIKQRTVDFRPNYDGQHVEPEFCRSILQLLVNGSKESQWEWPRSPTISGKSSMPRIVDLQPRCHTGHARRRSRTRLPLASDFEQSREELRDLQTGVALYALGAFGPPAGGTQASCHHSKFRTV